MPHRPSPTKGLFAGLAAGIVATIIMDQFQALLAEGQKESERRKKLAEGELPTQIAQQQRQQEKKQEESEGSTEKVARRIAEAAGYALPQDCRKSAGQAVHYSFGTLMGVAYAATAEFLPSVTAGGGTAFATLLFVGADEIAVPSLHLSGAATEMPASAHLQYWAAHLVYGGALELTRSLVRRLSR